MVFFIKLGYDESKNIDGWEDRMELDKILRSIGYKCIEICGSRALYSNDGKFDIFEVLVRNICKLKGYILEEISERKDPGIGIIILKSKFNL